jgi:hypothetical protein
MTLFVPTKFDVVSKLLNVPVEVIFPPNELFPLAICKDNGVVIVVFVPAVGAPVMYKLAAFVTVLAEELLIVTELIELIFALAGFVVDEVYVNAGMFKILPSVVVLVEVNAEPIHIFFETPIPPDAIIEPVELLVLAVVDEADMPVAVNNPVLGTNVKAVLDTFSGKFPEVAVTHVG